jgi:hypothetical protein
MSFKMPCAEEHRKPIESLIKDDSWPRRPESSLIKQSSCSLDSGRNVLGWQFSMKYYPSGTVLIAMLSWAPADDNISNYMGSKTSLLFAIG